VRDALPAAIRYRIEANLKVIQQQVLNPAEDTGSGHGTEGQEKRDCHTYKTDSSIAVEKKYMLSGQLKQLTAELNRRSTVENYTALVSALEKGVGIALWYYKGNSIMEKAMIHLEEISSSPSDSSLIRRSLPLKCAESVKMCCYRLSSTIT
jgi:hypothetical protein